MIFILIGVYGALRHPVVTIRAWSETLRARRHPGDDLGFGDCRCPCSGCSGCVGGDQ